MHEVKRAIIMAAGLGNRMRPVTLTTPKPLVRVNGKRMIDTVIEGLHDNGIMEIYIVAGYLKEQFYELENEYPGVTIIENPYYESCNNISSLYALFDGDVDPNSSESNEEEGYYLPWNLDMEKYGDFDNSLNIDEINESLNEMILEAKDILVNQEINYVKAYDIDTNY